MSACPDGAIVKESLFGGVDQRLSPLTFHGVTHFVFREVFYLRESPVVDYNAMPELLLRGRLCPDEVATYREVRNAGSPVIRGRSFPRCD